MGITEGRNFGMAACKHLGIDIKRVRVTDVGLATPRDGPLQLHVTILVDKKDLESIAANMTEKSPGGKSPSRPFIKQARVVT